MNKPTMTDDIPVTIRVTVVGTDNPLDVLDESTADQWLSYLGPTAMVLARRLVDDDGGEYDLAPLADSLGVGVPVLWRAFNRLLRAKLVTIDVPDVTIMDHWPNSRRGAS